MADGSYKRLTLYPQLLDGNITCTVHFENEEVQEKPAVAQPVKQSALVAKIDRLILNNDLIINQSSSTREPLVAPEKNLIKGSQKCQKIRPRPVKKGTSMVKQRTKCGRDGLTAEYSRSVLKRVRLGHAESSADDDDLFQGRISTGALHFPIIPRIPLVDPLQGRLQEKTEKTILTRRPLLPKKSTNPRRGPSNNATEFRKRRKLTSSSSKKESDVIAGHPNTLPTDNEKLSRAEADVACSAVPPPLSPTAPLGSSTNPITLVQNGQVFQSKHLLTDVQVRQITAILKKHTSQKSSEDAVIDPATNAKINYKVTYSSQMDNSPSSLTTSKKEKDCLKTAAVNPPTDHLDEPNVEVCKEDEVGGENQGPQTKIAKMSRTRSGRLSRPPMHIIKDYKRIALGQETSKRPLLEEQLMDYANAVEEPALLPTTPSIPLNQYIKERVKKHSNVKEDFKCPTCKKVYLGHDRMMVHLQKFPDHSNIVEYARKLNKPRLPVRPRPNKRRLKRIVANMERTIYGPILAETFNMWELLLLRVGLKGKTGAYEVEALLTELYGLLDKIGRVFEELLVPVYENEDSKGDGYIHLDKHNVAYALGMAQGSYKINPKQSHLLKLDPLPQPTRLAPTAPPNNHLKTTFESNLSNKLLDCSNDSVDLDCDMKEVETRNDKNKVWASSKGDDTSSEFLSQFLDSNLPSGGDEEIVEWKHNSQIACVENKTTCDEPIWKSTDPVRPIPAVQTELWKNGENPCAANSADLWKQATAEKRWNSSHNAGSQELWKDNSDSSWKTNAEVEHNPNKKKDGWAKDARERISGNAGWSKVKCESSWESVTVGPGIEKESKKDWLRHWKEEGGGSGAAMPNMRTSRLTSTPETQSALLSPPLRRNSVSSFSQSHQEELLSLDLHELFDDLIPEQAKPRPKPGSIESIINEALFPGSGRAPSHSSLPTLIPDPLDEVTNLDFLNQD